MRFRVVGAAATMILVISAVTVTITATAQASSPRAGVSQAPISDSATLIAGLVTQGGHVTAGNKWVLMPSGVQVSVVPMALSDCTSGYICLFENANFTGRLLKSNQPGARIDLSANSFNDIMSSWANESPYDAKWFYNAGFGGTARCMQAETTNSNVGSTDNDKASSLAIYTDSLAC